MTIRFSKETQCMIAQCDVCFDVVEFEDLTEAGTDGYMNAKERIDMDGWTTSKIGDKWHNACCDCHE